MPNQHVVPYLHGWAVKPEGGERAYSVHITQAEAVAQAIELARDQRTAVLIQGHDGRVRMRAYQDAASPQTRG